MSSILPSNEQLKRAVKWISEQLKDDEDKKLKLLIQEAILRFDLDPIKAEFLINFYKKESTNSTN